MSKHLGDFDASTIIYGKFTTFQPSTGAAFALAGTPALSVYKDNSTTESTSGVTLTVSFDSRTGLNHFAIDTSSDGTFYAAGSFFDIVITAGTVDSVSVVGAVVGSFTIRKNSSLKPATAGRTLVVDSAGLADATTVKLGPSGSGTAQTARDLGTSVLISSGTATGQLNVTSGVVDANATKVSGTAQTARDLGASVLLSPGTGTGQISLTSGAVTVVSTQLPVAIKKNTALAGFVFLMVDGSNVPVTGLTITAQRSIDGAAVTSCTNAASEISGGLYKINLSAADLNGNFIMLIFSSLGAQTRYVPVVTQA